MTFKGILDQVGTWGAQHALPVFFGDEATRNRLANDITGDFIFVDIPGGRQDYNDYAAETFSITAPAIPPCANALTIACAMLIPMLNMASALACLACFIFSFLTSS